MEPARIVSCRELFEQFGDIAPIENPLDMDDLMTMNLAGVADGPTKKFYADQDNFAEWIQRQCLLFWRSFTFFGEGAGIPIRNDMLKELPRESALYWLCDDAGKLLYIGRAKNLYKRWKRHDKKGRAQQCPGCLLEWATMSAMATEIMEPVLIRHFKPPWNTIGVDKPTRLDRIGSFPLPALAAISFDDYT